MSRTILIADDNEGVRKSFRAVLDALGHRCLEAEDGLSCTEMLESPEIDLVIADLFMPSFDIHDLLNQAAQHPNQPPVIIVTAQDDDREIERLLKAGAKAYLVKPVDIEQIERLFKDL
jgi:CheY-like chemotaxis protein